MSTPRIEQAGTKDRFTLAEIRGFIAEQNKRKPSPGHESRAKAAPTFKGVKFPELAKRSGNAPTVSEPPSIQHARLKLRLSK